MIRRIIHIDEEKCTGCGLCAAACHEGAIDIVDGKARLVRENFCDGLGDCLPQCPAGAIRFEEREAPAYDEAAVMAAKAVKAAAEQTEPCSGDPELPGGGTQVSRLAQWPCQIKLVPERAPFFDGTDLLIAADCTAYAYAGIHEDFMKGRVTVIGCPKLDAVDYSEKLAAILRSNDIRSVILLRMEVPCCGGLQRAAEKAIRESGRFIPWQVVTISRNGEILG
ncbi:MAG: 4Fe-4S binding protein [Oscillospiraceae bacterium]|nr:4Fe-4S binding protein [Oscillospiraceae bacterium]